MDEVDLSSQQPYTEDDLKYYQELQHYGLSVANTGRDGSIRFVSSVWLASTLHIQCQR